MSVTPNIPILELTAENFAPYGTLLEPKPNATIERGDITYWHAQADLSGLEHDGVLSFLHAFKREPILEDIERHLHTPEAFIPLEGESLMVVGAPGELDLSSLRAFKLDHTRAVLLHAGTWHWAPYPITPTSSFVLILRASTVPDDVHVIPIAPHRIG
jgi:ureidoglycolate lyase